MKAARKTSAVAPLAGRSGSLSNVVMFPCKPVKAAAQAIEPAIKLIPSTSKVWPKFTSVRALPLATRRDLADYMSLIDPSCPSGTAEGLFGVANVLNRAGLTFADLGRNVYDPAEAEEERVAA